MSLNEMKFMDFEDDPKFIPTLNLYSLNSILNFVYLNI